MARSSINLLILLLLPVLLAFPALAQNDAQIQIFEGTIASGETRIYALDIQPGDTLYAFASNQGGAYDPVLAVLRENQTGDYTELTFDDDSAGGLNAALSIEIVESGTYALALSSPDESPGGDYQLAVGINAPQLLDGDLSVETQANIASFTGVSLQDERIIQIFEETITSEGTHYYTLPERFEGDTLHIRVDNLSGNYDPFMQILDESGEIIFEADDDAGLDIRFQGDLPADGNYELAIIEHFGVTFGRYRLSIGLNSPSALTDNATQTIGEDELFMTLDRERSRTGIAIEEITDSIEAGADDFYRLEDSNPGDTLYIYVESLTEGFTPQLDLTNFVGKIVATGDTDGSSSRLSFAFPDNTTDYTFFVYSEDFETGGDYRLLAGINEPSILEGTAEPNDTSIIRDPITIDASIYVEQISEVNQLGEYFEAVVTFRANWVDTREAFDASDCQCTTRSFSGTGFDAYFEGAAEGGVLEWPEFIFVNQQGERQIHYHLLDIGFDGSVYFEEQFTGRFRVDFDFTRLPFDRQQFWIRVTTPFNADYMQLIPAEDETWVGFSEDLGEEEWLILDSSTDTFIENNGSVYSFDFSTERHLTYYIYRLFIPLLLIVFLGWAIFLIDDHDARIAASSGNLLIFIAFNFTIADDLPRLSYLTFMDGLLIVCFVISSLAFVVSVYIRWLDNRDKDDLLHLIDRLTVWLYPVSFIISGILLVLIFLQ